MYTFRDAMPILCQKKTVLLTFLPFNSQVLRKLIIFTALMILGPLVAFFTSQALFESSLVSGGIAAVVANVVLIGYVYVAFNENIDGDSKEKKES